MGELHTQAAKQLEEHLKSELPKEIKFYVKPVSLNLENLILVVFQISQIRFSTLVRERGGADLPETITVFKVIYKFEGLNE